MEDIVLYSTNCPRCKTLKLMLEKAGLKYDTVTHMDTILEMAKENGLQEIPILETKDGVFGFVNAMHWIREQ